MRWLVLVLLSLCFIGCTTGSHTIIDGWNSKRPEKEEVESFFSEGFRQGDQYSSATDEVEKDEDAGTATISPGGIGYVKGANYIFKHIPLTVSIKAVVIYKGSGMMLIESRDQSSSLVKDGYSIALPEGENRQILPIEDVEKYVNAKNQIKVNLSTDDTNTLVVYSITMRYFRERRSVKIVDEDMPEERCRTWHRYHRGRMLRWDRRRGYYVRYSYWDRYPWYTTWVKRTVYVPGGYFTYYERVIGRIRPTKFFIIVEKGNGRDRRSSSHEDVKRRFASRRMSVRTREKKDTKQNSKAPSEKGPTVKRTRSRTSEYSAAPSSVQKETKKATKTSTRRKATRTKSTEKDDEKKKDKKRSSSSRTRTEQSSNNSSSKRKRTR